MSNIILAAPASDIATVTGSVAMGSNDIFNVQRRDLFRVYRTSLESFIAFDFGEVKSIDFIALVGHNGTTSGTVIIRAGATDECNDYASDPISLVTGEDLGFNSKAAVVKFAAQEYRFWRLEIEDSTNPDGFFQVGRVYLSKCFQPVTNASYGLEEGVSDRTRVSRTISGAISPTKRETLRTARWVLNFGRKSEMLGVLREIDLSRGIAEDVVFIPDMDDSDHFQSRYIYGSMDSLNPIVTAAFSIYQKSYNITEIK